MNNISNYLCLSICNSQKKRKEREARLAAEAKREADARLARYNDVLALQITCLAVARHTSLSVVPMVALTSSQIGMALKNLVWERQQRRMVFQ